MSARAVKCLLTWLFDLTALSLRYEYGKPAATVHDYTEVRSCYGK
jgi:hypothetical protein